MIQYNIGMMSQQFINPIHVGQFINPTWLINCFINQWLINWFGEYPGLGHDISDHPFIFLLWWSQSLLCFCSLKISADLGNDTTNRHDFLYLSYRVYTLLYIYTHINLKQWDCWMLLWEHTCWNFVLFYMIEESKSW